MLASFSSLVRVRPSSAVVLVSGFLTLLVACAGGTNLDEELTITYEQKFMIDKLRQRILPYITESYMKEDLYLLRWLRHTKFNLEEAQRKVIDNIKWRKQNKIDKLHEEDFSDLKDEFPFTFSTDKQGQPSFFGFAGQWDVRGAVLTGRAQRVIRYINKALEGGARMIRDLQHAGKNVTRLNLIIDLDGFNLAQHGCVACLFRVLDFLTLYDSNYPGLADHVVFTNTPPTIAAAAELVRGNANSETLKAIKVYGRDKNVWQKALLEFMDRDKLPARLGGTLQEK